MRIDLVLIWKKYKIVNTEGWLSRNILHKFIVEFGIKL